MCCVGEEADDYLSYPVSYPDKEYLYHQQNKPTTLEPTNEISKQISEWDSAKQLFF